MVRLQGCCWWWWVVVAAVVGTGWVCSVWLLYSTTTITNHYPQPASWTLTALINSVHHTSSESTTATTHTTPVISPKRKLSVLESAWGSVMTKRLARVKRVCQQHYLSLKRFSFLNKFTYDTQHHLAYCRNAKTGTTSWLGHLLEWAGVEISNMTPYEIHEAANQAFPALPSKDAAQEMQHLPITFTVVRHPFTRLVSAYRDKMPEKYKKDLQMRMISKYRVHQRNISMSDNDITLGISKFSNKIQNLVSELKNASVNNVLSSKAFDTLSTKETSAYRYHQTIKGALLAQNDSREIALDASIPTFREFVLFVSDQVLKCSSDVSFQCFNEIDVHWQPIFNRCAPCDIHYDVIAKTETFSEDEEYLSELMGLPLHSTGTAKLHSRDPSTASLTKKYFSTLSQHERERVVNAYFYDFLLFGYSPDNINQ